MGQEDYVSIRELERQGRVSYGDQQQRRVCDEKWAEEVYVMPSDISLVVVRQNYESEGASGTNFHLISDKPLTSVKGNIRNAAPLNCLIPDQALQVVEKNILIHMNVKGDKKSPKLEIIANRIE